MFKPQERQALQYRLDAARDERMQYMMAKARVELRLKIAMSVGDDKMKNDLYVDAERIQKAIALCDSEVDESLRLLDPPAEKEA